MKTITFEAKEKKRSINNLENISKNFGDNFHRHRTCKT